jgi:hypothetical protein
MTRITYEIVEHDGGWAYRVDGVVSETFPSHDAARRAAERAAAEQRVPGNTAGISYEDKDGRPASRTHPLRRIPLLLSLFMNTAFARFSDVL